MQEQSGWQGTFDVFVRDGECWRHEKTIPNMVTNIGLDLLRDTLRGTVTDAQIKYIAVGTSSASVVATSTQLGAEIFRKPVYSRTAGTTGILVTIGILEDSEAVANIEEIGVFAGSTASATTNSGIMISRILYSRNKTNLESIQIQRTDTIGRV